MALHCPLCETAVDAPAFTAHKKAYARCPLCDLLFMMPEYRPVREDELAHYLLHENDPRDERYRAFLRRLTDEMTPRLRPGALGLDYGAGPGPAISVMLDELGFTVRDYDPFFHPDEAVLHDAYDFIVCSETAEHFYAPARDFARLDGLLKPGGWLGLMTGILYEEIDFAQWRYAREPVHVSFYSQRTLGWIARRFGWRVEFPRANVALFCKPPYAFLDAKKDGEKSRIVLQ